MGRRSRQGPYPGRDVFGKVLMDLRVAVFEVVFSLYPCGVHSEIRPKKRGDPSKPDFNVSVESECKNPFIHFNQTVTRNCLQLADTYEMTL